MSFGIGKALITAPALIVFAAAWAAVEFVERIQCYLRARRERAQLLAMGDRELHDLGLSRVDAIRYATEPAWRDCARLGKVVP